MKRCLFLLFLLCYGFIYSQESHDHHNHSHEQHASKILIGDFDTFRNLFVNKGLRRRTTNLEMQLPDRSVQVLAHKELLRNGVNDIIGTVKGTTEKVVIQIDEVSKEVLGYIYTESQDIAYRYFSEEQEVYVEEVNIHEVLCVRYDELETTETELEGIEEAPLDFSGDPYELESNPGVTAVIYLDFDGETVDDSWWNSGDEIIAAPSGFSDTKVKQIWQAIAEDFYPFNVNVTTNRTVYDSAPINRKTQCVFTPSRDWYGSAGGVAYLRSFRNSSLAAKQCWVFNAGTKGAYEAGSHEVGHTMGLSHDGVLEPNVDTLAYYSGHEEWGAIMGSSYTRDVAQWSKGEYEFADRTQDDIALITNSNNGFGYRQDDHSNTITGATPLLGNISGDIEADENDGIIERTTDFDVFSFNTSGGQFQITASPAVFSPNLNILMRLLDVQGNEVSVSNPTNTLSCSINQSLDAGTYYIEISGTGEKNPLTDGYSDYGSLGYFVLSGFIEGFNGGGNSQVTNIDDLIVEELSCTEVSLSWGDKTGEDGYRITRKLLSEVDYTILEDVSADQTTYLDQSVTENSSYLYQVSPLINSQVVATSNTPEITTSACPLPTPPITDIYIVNMESCGGESGKVTFFYDDTEGRTHVEFSFDGGGTYLPQVQDNLGSYTYNQPAGVYDIWVRWGDNSFPLDLGIIEIECTEPFLIPGTIEAEDFFNQSGVENQPTTDEGGGENVGFIESGDFTEYLVDVGSEEYYIFEFRVASKNNGGTIGIWMGDTQKGEVSVPGTGNWQNWITITQTVLLDEGDQKLRLVYNGDSGYLMNINRIVIREDDSIGSKLNPIELNPFCGVSHQNSDKTLYYNCVIPLDGDLYVGMCSEQNAGTIDLMNTGLGENPKLNCNESGDYYDLENLVAGDNLLFSIPSTVSNQPIEVYFTPDGNGGNALPCAQYAIWRGEESTDWNETQNWEKNELPSVDDVLIVPNVNNSLELSSNQNVKVKGVIIFEGVELLLDETNMEVE